ncbi:MAG: FAD-dependent oxidoreductase [bacterium]
MAIIKKYKSILKEIANPLSGIYTLTFSSEKKFNFRPGQFLHLALDEYDGIGQWPESRCFSMQSNPDAAFIKITFAVQGVFTARMVKELYEGKEVWLKMPYGDLFDRGNSKENCVFIAGGTGITPFLSLFTYKTFDEYINPKIYLGFRKQEYNLYNDEISNIKNTSKSIQMIYENVDGIINIETIYKKNDKNSSYFISGPPIMIKSFKNYLMQQCVEESKIFTDDWV